MAKIKLGERPKNFKHAVEFELLDGSKAVIEMVFTYRTRKEFGEHVDHWQKTRQAAAEAEMAERLKSHEDAVAAAKEAGEEPPLLDLMPQAELQSKAVEGTADYIMTIAEGWNLDGQEFNLDTVQQLCDEFPAAAAAIGSAYRIAITEGRRGN